MTTLTSSFTACGVTVTLNPDTGTITFSDTAGRSITVPAGYASDIAHEVCGAMREGVTDGDLWDESGKVAIAYDGTIGSPAPGTDYGSITEVPDKFWCVTDLYLGIFAAVAGIKSAPTQDRLAGLGVTGYIAQGGPHYENDGHALFVSSLDAARLLGVDEAALLRLGGLGLLGGRGRRDGAILATEVLRACIAQVPPLVVRAVLLTTGKPHVLVHYADRSRVTKLWRDDAATLADTLASNEGSVHVGAGIYAPVGAERERFASELRDAVAQLDGAMDAEAPQQL